MNTHLVSNEWSLLASVADGSSIAITNPTSQEVDLLVTSIGGTAPAGDYVADPIDKGVFIYSGPIDVYVKSSSKVTLGYRLQ
jgi:hypothetical protein